MDGFSSKKTLLVLVLLTMTVLIDGEFSLKAQMLCDTITTTSDIYFRVGYSIYQSDYRDNAQALESAIVNIEQARQADPDYRVVLTGASSPDGTYSNNIRLAKKRTDNISNLFTEELKQRGMDGELSHVSSQSVGIDWNGLAEMTDTVNQEWSDKMTELLRHGPVFLFDSNGTAIGSKLGQMVSIEGGKPYTYLKENLFPELRKVTIEVISVVPKPAKPEPFVEPETTVEPEPVEEITPAIPDTIPAAEPDTVQEIHPDPETIVKAEPQPEPTIEPASQPKPERPYDLRKFLALKSNLAFDLLTVLNAEIEIPIGDRYSFNVEYDGPWWLIDKSEGSYCLMANVVQLEGRYWFPPKNGKTDNPLNGVFAGLFGGTGRYDVQYKLDGRRGDFWNVGLGIGYSRSLANCLNLEFEIGFGLTSSQYETYIAKKDNTILAYQDTRKTTLLYPNRAHVSLVWNLFVKDYRK